MGLCVILIFVPLKLNMSTCIHLCVPTVPAFCGAVKQDSPAAPPL